MDEVLLAICNVLQRFIHFLMPRAVNAVHLLSWEGGKDDAVPVLGRYLSPYPLRSKRTKIIESSSTLAGTDTYGS